MASKTSKKSKKPIETTLGKAKPQKSENEVDISSVRKPIDTTVSGLRQAIALLDTATEEVKNYVMYECDIMYECKMCRNIFRSLANFILHKRNYCIDKFNPVEYLNNNGAYQEVIYPLPDNNKQNGRCLIKVKEKQKKTINPVIDKLLEKRKIEQLCKAVVSENLANNDKNKPVKDMEDCEFKFGNTNSIFLEKIDSNNAAVFQTLLRHRSDESVKSTATDRSDLTEKSDTAETTATSEKQRKKKVQEESNKIYDGYTETVKESGDEITNRRTKDNTVSMKAQVMEIHGILENDKIVVGPDGKLKGYYKEKACGNIFPKKYLICTECNVRFTTRKTLSFHLRTRHNNTAKIHFCPVCKELLANPWCVVRHLIRVHRMSNKQVKNLREKIHSSWVIQEDASAIEVKKKPGEFSGQDEPTDAENQWINNIEEDNDLQMCAGCGKRFERRAALHSHSVMCSKRIAVCATIKENNAKKREEEEALEKARQKQVLTLKGASKRKGTIIRRKTDTLPTENVKELSQISDEDPVENFSTAVVRLDTNSVDNCNSLAKRIEELGFFKCHQQTPFDAETLKNLPILTENSTALKSPTKEICIALPRQRVEDMEKLFKSEQLNEQKGFSSKTSATEVPTINDSVNKLIENKAGMPVFLNEKCKKQKICLIFKKSVKTNECSLDVDKHSTHISSLESMSNKYGVSNISDMNKIENKSRRLSRNSKLDIQHDYNNTAPIDKDYTNKTSLIAVNFNNSFKEISKRMQDNENSSKEEQGLGNSSDMSTNENSFENDNVLSSRNNLNVNTDEKPKSVISVLKKKRRLSKRSEKNNDQMPKKTRNADKTISCVSSSVDKTKVKTTKCKSSLVANIVQFNGGLDEECCKSQEVHSSIDMEHGFAGFPQEEIGDFTYAIKDFSSLSYNNPLRSLQKLKKGSPGKKDKRLKPNCKKPLRRRTRRKSLNLEDNEKANLYKKREMSFINKASPYMDQDRLCCIPCSLTFKSFPLLLWHMSAHFSWFRFQCSRCSFISFNKFDCIMHAKKQHLLTTESSISSVVLPVPNWKTILMSHEFRLLKDFENLKGKHTNETILLEDNNWSNPPIEEADNADSLSDDLFSDCDKKSVDSLSILTISSDSDLNAKSSGVIDIPEQSGDCQILKEPDELVVMPADISEVFDNLKYKDYVPFEERTPISGELLDESSNDTEFYLDIFRKIESPKTRSSSTKAEMTDERSSTPKSSKTLEDIFYEKDSPTLSVRPSRIRTKAKLHEDFVYYDLSNTIKIYDPTKNTNLKSAKVVSSKPISTLVQKKK